MLLETKPRLVLRDELLDIWQGQDVFARVQDLEGDVVRDQLGRKTLRCVVEGEVYYCKRHTGVGWKEIFKNLLCLRLPVISARNEWIALNRLAEIHIPSLTPVAYGERGFNPAKRQSFIVTRALTNVIQLDHYLSGLPQPLSFAARQTLLNQVAHIVRKMHAEGINHRDLYLCHFLLEPSSMAVRHEPIIYLIDLHRAQLRRQVPHRWLVKDLASLYFSVLDLEINQRDIYRFLRLYFGESLKHILRHRSVLLSQIRHRASHLYRRNQRLKNPDAGEPTL